MFFPSRFSKNILFPYLPCLCVIESQGMAAVSSKPIKEARFVQPRVCFILDAGNREWRREGHKGPFSPSTDSPLPDSTPTVGGGVVKGFIDRGRGCLQKQQSALMVILKLITSGLASISFAVLGAVNLSSRVSLFPFLWGRFSELWQLLLWVPSGHHVINLFHLVGASVSIKQLTGYGSEYCR